MRADELRRHLERLDNRPYPAYRDLSGRRFAAGPLTLRLLHVQGDPFAAPSRLEVLAPPDVPRLPAPATAGPDALRATADFLHRAVHRALGTVADTGGSGKSGMVAIAPVGQEVLERTGCVVAPDGGLRLVIEVGLPANGRRIRGRAAATLLCDALPEAVVAALDGYDVGELRRWVEGVEDQVALRGQLAAWGLVAFLADGAVLPRRSGVDDRPMAGDPVPLVAPDGLAVTLDSPHGGPLRGLGVSAGVTLIVGGGYHGKSTLLDAIARGVYDHRPGDGRERCVTVGEAVCVRAEDGRSVRGVDLRPFIGALPGGRETRRFETDDASGSTSQAAGIVEAIEAGARALLIDEDTAATNFMIRDGRMRRLIPAGGEPITPYLDRVRQLAGRGVSSVLVVGGAGDYLDVADRVIRMGDYRPHDATADARRVAAALPLGEAAPKAPGPWPDPPARCPVASGFDARGRRGRPRARAVQSRSRRARAIELGEAEIDVSLLPQLVDPAQARAIGDALLALGGLADGRRSLPDLLDALEARMADGLVGLCGDGVGDRARPRRFEIAAAINRLRSLALS